MAYDVTENYKKVIYSGDSRHKIKILFNNVELQEADRYCERATIKSRIIPNGSKRFSLNNFISKEVELILHNVEASLIQDQVSISIGTLVGNSYEYVPIGIFNIQGTPTTDKNKITIKLRDNSVKFDFNYNAKPLIDEKGGSATKMQILQDICTKAGVNFYFHSFLGDSDIVGIYDNTITARQYIADIAEQAGCIATITRGGSLAFGDIKDLTTWDIPLSIVEKYELGKTYRIGKVVYEDAIRKYETPNTNYDILYLDSSNPYISNQEQINSIFEKVKDFTIDSVKTGKILGNPAIDGFDLINVYDDKVEGNPTIFKTLATNELVYTGALTNTFDTQIGEEERKENVSIGGEATFKKWATTSINNITGEILIQAGKIDTLEDSVETYTTSLDIYNITIPVDANKKPLENKTYQIGYYAYFKGSQVTPTVTILSTATGITQTISNNKINLAVSTNTTITNLTNELSYRFDYIVNGETYSSTLKVMVVLAQKGEQGTQGVPGTNGVDGKTSYLHIKYSEDGTTFTPAQDGYEIGEKPSRWQGTYVDFNATDSTTFSDYDWVDTAIVVEDLLTPTQDLTGTSFYLEDSTDADLVNFEMEGKTTQETSTQGKNLFDEDYYRNATYSTNVYKYTLARFKGNRTLYAKAQLKSGGSAISGLYACISSAPNPNTSGAVYSMVISNGEAKQNLSSNFTNKEDLYFSFYPTSTTLAQIFDNYNIWVSTDNINYVPFVPDMPSPNYPSELVSVGYKNIFDSENWYNTLHNLNNESMTKEVVDEIEYYKFRPSSIYNYQYMLGKFEQNTQYILTCKARMYENLNRTSTGFRFIYTDGTNSNEMIKSTTEEYEYKLVSTPGKTISYIVLNYNYNDYALVRDILLTRGEKEHLYIPYDKYGIEITTTGSNLFDISKVITNSTRLVNNGDNITINTPSSSTAVSGTSPNKLKDYCPTLKVGDEVYLQANTTGTSTFVYLSVSQSYWGFGSKKTITQNDLDSIVYWYASGVNTTATISNIQIKKETETTYEEFKSKTYLYTLNQPLRSIGDVKDLLYIKDGMLYVERKIGNVVLNGSENWQIRTDYSYTNHNVFRNADYRVGIFGTGTTGYSNYFKINASQQETNMIRLVNTNGYGTQMTIEKSIASSVANLKTWLSNNNVKVNFILLEPYTEELGQVDIPNTYKTITHIDTTDELQPNMAITYVRDTQVTNYVEEHVAQIKINEDSIVSRVETIESSDYDSRINAVEQRQTDSELAINVISTNIDKTTGQIREVTTTTGFTFNAEGLTISDSSSKFSALHRNDGTFYKDGDTTVGQYTKDGSKQKDLYLFGVYYYGMEDINSTPRFIAQLYNDGNEDGVGHFWNEE